MKFLNDIEDASKLVQDSTHRLVTDAEKEIWNNKTSAPTSVAIDTRLEALEADATTKTYVDTQDALKADKATTYSKTEVDAKDALKVDKTTTINGQALSANISITAADIPNAPEGGIAAITVQAAINELDAESAALTNRVTALESSSPGVILTLTAADIGNIPAGGITETTVQEALNELDMETAKNLYGGAEQTVVAKNKYIPLLADTSGTLVARWQKYVGVGASFIASSNFGFGTSALENNTGTSANGFGDRALQNNKGTYANGFGTSALENNTGTYASGLGYCALSKNTGTYASGLGAFALQNNTGAYTSGFGYCALENNKGGSSNGFGYYALNNNTGASASGFGSYALNNNTGSYVNGFGASALRNNAGSYVNGFGASALSNNIGEYSNGFGDYALHKNTGAYTNGFGGYTLQYNQRSNNTALGHSAYANFLDDPSGNKTCDSSAINLTSERATIPAHGFGKVNEIVNLKYAGSTGTPISGLPMDEIFQAKIIDSNTIEFVVGSTLRNIISQGTGTHTFTPQYAYSNTTSLGANSQPNKDNQVVLGNPLVDTVKMGGTARTPESSTAPGVKGETCWDANYFYICVATNIWKRTPLTAW